MDAVKNHHINNFPLHEMNSINNFPFSDPKVDEFNPARDQRYCLKQIETNISVSPFHLSVVPVDDG
ncbi:CLUMA_CG021192, isoform A [Clunio marinus]|uniref:CLUMA_CG021192, isoform A n=1 Tax=Clunio marinus TaxID=568069 RepID=A0A1J1J664_9DIPT|nr:CLUMA_CG021192, isoform A [Clunio marinus]